MQTPVPQKKKIGFEDFELKRIIGKGSYGDVFLVYKQGQPYAMKEIIKRKLHKQKKQYQAMVERELLRVMKHPGIIKLKYAFQDKNKLYFVMDFCHLGEFVRFIKEYVEYLTDSVRRFYVAEIVNLLEYLHSKGITHRDLKPQNLLLSREGHLKLVDFGTCEISTCSLLSEQFRGQIQKQKACEELSQQEPVEQCPQLEETVSPRKRRSTFVGTSYYISPELLQHNVCEPPSDLWALGCILYQLYYLETPFKDSTEYGVFEKIKAVDLEFPKNDAITPQAVDLIRKLLVKNPDERLGSCSRQELNFHHLKSHPFFQGIDVDSVFTSVPPDIGVKRFSMETEQTLQLRVKQFTNLSLNLLKEKETIKNNQSSNQILIEGVIEKRQFPYYQHVYMRVYAIGNARLVSMERPEKVEELEFGVQKGKEDMQRAQSVDSQAGLFSLELKGSQKEIFKCPNMQQWVEAINGILLNR